MIENKELFNRMAAEWIKEFMFRQKSFTVQDVLNAMPLKHLGIDFDKAEFGDKQKDEVWDVVESLIPVYAPHYGYERTKGNVWRQANKKGTPWFETTVTGGNVSNAAFTGVNDVNTTITVNPDENWDDCNGVISGFATTTNSETEGFELPSPFENYCKGLRALLGADPDVTVVQDSKNKVINICVAGCDKPTAYRVYFPGEVEMKGIGKVTFLVNGHAKTYKTKANPSIIRNMFAGHPLVDAIRTTKFPDGDADRFFVIFKNVTIQYKNDNFGSIWSTTTTTPEELAKMVLPKAADTGITFWKTTVAGDYEEDMFFD